MRQLLLVLDSRHHVTILESALARDAVSQVVKHDLQNTTRTKTFLSGYFTSNFNTCSIELHGGGSFVKDTRRLEFSFRVRETTWNGFLRTESTTVRKVRLV